ncbi:hypothetical protein hrd7_15360 [Leptolinea sp. HRD-7]|nr:hypothetical protein hrd7_15360 [Leptolinea sp. HRD-7]
MNLIDNFEGAETNPFLLGDRPTDIQKFIRTLAFQQFWIQKKFRAWTISRQKVLFCSLPTDNPIRKTIEESLKLDDIEYFLELSWLVWAWLMNNPRAFIFSPGDLFHNLDYSKHEINSFCSAISLLPDDVKKFLNNRKQLIENPFLQLTEISPFVRYPFLKIEEKILVYSQEVLKETISNIFYDVMKSEGGSSLAEKFGTELEKYVGRCISSLGFAHYIEKDLFRAFPKENVVDFLLPFSEFALLIEVKAIEMRPIVKVNPKNKPLQHELQDSVIKGVIQGFSLANSIKQAQDNLNILNRTNFFLMVVTYKDLYLGPGDIAWEEFIEESVAPILAERQIDSNLIPHEQIIFLSIEEFDQLIGILWQKSASITEIFSEMLQSNSNWKTRKWLFSQQLDKFQQKEIRHPILDDEFNAFVKILKKDTFQILRYKNIIVNIAIDLFSTS